VYFVVNPTSFLRHAGLRGIASCHQLQLHADLRPMTLGKSDPPPIRVAVLGVGSLGRHHARLYAELAATGVIQFAGVYDTDASIAEQIAREYRTQAFTSLEAAAEAADALSVVTPTVTHHELASGLLQRNRHVLVEKPITQTEAQAGELVQLAQERNLVLQVGHVERFNPVFTYLESVVKEPRFIETHRLSPYPKRSTDVGVVLDLMIHDLDIVLAFVKSPITSVDAVGVSVLSQSEDIANARLRFANGCVANVTVSRVNPERMRKIRVFSAGEEPSYVSLDYAEQKGYIYRLARSDEKESSLLRKLLAAKDSTIVTEFAGRKIVREPVPITREEPLKLELKHFVDCVRERQQPRVSGVAAKAALEIALEITRQIGSVAALPA
jgi:predicted dehydrogenase